MTNVNFKYALKETPRNCTLKETGLNINNLGK